MAIPTHPVSLTPAQLDELNRKLSKMRHDVNGCLTLVVAASELIRMKPEATEKMLTAMAEQPKKIKQVVDQFSAEFEAAFGITRP